jgi:ABC-type transport system substrate-binding protein
MAQRLADATGEAEAPDGATASRVVQAIRRFATLSRSHPLSTVECNFRPNWTRFCDPRLDARIARRARQEPADPTGTAGLAAAIDRELTDRAPWVPLLTPHFVAVTSARVGNYQVNNGALLLDQLWVR